jgi:mannose-6-phosphate isomerase
MDWHPLTFAPILKATTWGGRRLETTLGKRLPPGERVGESWEVSDWPGDVSVVAGGPLAGRSLHELLEADATALLGRPQRAADGGRFPLLAKFIDAAEDLSVQVHPSDATEARLGPSARAKTECWYVVAAAPGAAVFLGARPGVTREAFASAIRSEDRARILETLNRIEVKAGDFIHVPGGTVHAIGAGTLLAEISQTSDTTLRLFDWNRRPRRPMHVEEGLAIATVGDNGAPDAAESVGKRTPVAAAGGPASPGRSAHLSQLVVCPAFSVYGLHLRAGGRLRFSETARGTLWMTVAGRAEMTWKAGEHWIETRWEAMAAADPPGDRGDTALSLSPGRTLFLPAGPYAVDLTAGDADLVALLVSSPE